MILFNREKLLQLLKVLNLPDEAIESVSQAYFSSPQVSLLSLLLKTISNFEPANPTTNSIGKMKSADTVPLSDLEDGVGAKLLRIEGKYEKILQQVFYFKIHLTQNFSSTVHMAQCLLQVEERRRGVVKSLLKETSPEKEDGAPDLDLMGLNRELRRREELAKKEKRKEEKEVRRRKKMLRQESLDTSSSTAVASIAESDRDVLSKESRDALIAHEKDKTIQNLCQKLEQFLVSQDKEREHSLAVAKKLALAEEELKNFHEKEKDQGEETRKRENSEDMAKMTELVSQQMSKLAEQAKLIQDLRVQVEVGRVGRIGNEQKENVGKHEKQKTTTATSPTEDFLREVKEKVEELSREQMEIDDEFEDFNQTSLME